MMANKKTCPADKEAFAKALSDFVKELGSYVASEDGQWTVKGFIDIFKNIYTISSDTKSFPRFLKSIFFPVFSSLPGIMVTRLFLQNARIGIQISVSSKTTIKQSSLPLI